MVYVIQVCWRLAGRIMMELQFQNVFCVLICQCCVGGRIYFNNCVKMCTFLSIPPRFPTQSITFQKVLRLRPFALQVRATCRERLLWSIFGMVQAGEKWRTRKKPMPLSRCPQESSHRLGWDRTRASAIKSRRITAWATTDLWRLTQVYIIHKNPVRISRRPQRASIRKTNW
jgi:hypothetical protein